MRSKSRTVLLALLAVLAFSALATSEAFAALPEFVSSGTAIPFTGTTTELLFRDATGSTYTCSAGTVTGEVPAVAKGEGGTKLVDKVIIKSGSCLKFLTLCNKPFETRHLKGRVAYLSKATKSVGLLLEPEVAGEPVFTCESESVPVTVKGSVIAPITPVNTRTTSFHARYAQSSGVQEIRKFEGEEALHNLEWSFSGGPFHPVGLATELALTFKREAELRA